MVLLQASAVLQHQGLRNARRVVSDPLGQLLCEVGQPRLQRLQARNQGLEGLEGQKLFPLQIGHDLLRVDALCQAPDGSALRLPEVPLQLPEGHPHELPASRLGFEARGRANALTELAAQTAQLPQGDGLHEAAHACGRHQRLAVRLVASRSKLGTDLVVSNAGRHGEACLCSNLLPDPLHENEGGEQQCIAEGEGERFETVGTECECGCRDDSGVLGDVALAAMFSESPEGSALHPAAHTVPAAMACKRSGHLPSSVFKHCPASIVRSKYASSMEATSQRGACLAKIAKTSSEA
mmetsp:Transcript_65535/g.213384  ORF Transcript_65535/g.213384 Transcript_65535/m.213384 type:complete len:295 (-) Transcript_65535:436-1320(-)